MNQRKQFSKDNWNRWKSISYAYILSNADHFAIKGDEKKSDLIPNLKTPFLCHEYLYHIIKGTNVSQIPFTHCKIPVRKCYFYTIWGAVKKTSIPYKRTLVIEYNYSTLLRLTGEVLQSKLYIPFENNIFWNNNFPTGR